MCPFERASCRNAFLKISVASFQSGGVRGLGLDDTFSGGDVGDLTLRAVRLRQDGKGLRPVGHDRGATGQKEHTTKRGSRNDDPGHVLPPRCVDFEEGIEQQPCQRGMSVFNILKILDYD